jgi:hypothetical protein
MQNLLEDQDIDVRIAMQWIIGTQNMNSSEITNNRIWLRAFVVVVVNPQVLKIKEIS